MRKTTVTVLLAVVTIAAFMWWRRGGNSPLHAQIEDRSTVESPQSVAKPETSERIPRQPSAVSQFGAVSPSIDSSRTQSIRNYLGELRADPLYGFKTPMQFYGKVLDETEAPVAGAGVHFEWNNLTSSSAIERGNVDASTDTEGFFSFDGRRGARLFVSVGKGGYYPSKTNPLAFEYADPGDGAYFTPNPQQPVVFHLRRKGHGVPLITSQNGMRSNVKLSFPMDGTSVAVDLLRQKQANTGPLQLSQSKPPNTPSQDASAWSFQMAIPDGGFVETHDEFPFEAPEAGYQPIVQLDFQKGQTNWTTDVQRDYYIQFGNPPLYGKLHLETSVDDAGARLTYSINPTGSRNLEPE